MKPVLISTIILILGIFTGRSYGQNFTVIDTLPDGAYGNAAWGDFDHDGFMDLAYLTQAIPNTICKVYHNVDDVFTEVPQHFPYLFNPGVKWGDLNNDGFDDLVVNGMDSLFHCRTFIYQSLGNGTFISIPNSIFGLSAGSVDIADYNHDGLKDIAVAGNDSVGINHAFIYKNLGGFQFADIHAPLIGIHFGEIKWGDYDRDSLMDIVINGIGDLDFRTRVYKNMGDDHFELQPFYMRGSGGTVDWADLDGDGWLDILVTGYDSTSSTIFTELHHNNGDGTFSIANTNLPDFGEPSGVAIADFNFDQKPDLCFIGGNSAFPFTGSAIALYLNDNVYNVEPFIRGDVINPIISAADIDSDGDNDLIFGNLILTNEALTAVKDMDQDHQVIHIFPNPASDHFTVNSMIPLKSITLYDYFGKIITSYSYLSLSNEIVTDQLSSAAYLLKMTDTDGKTYINKLMVIHE